MTENKYLADGPLVVAIDSSTTSTKAIVVDAEGNIWHTSKQNIQLHTPAMDQYEHNPIRWWETNRATIGEVLSKLSPTDRSRIAAIGITHQRESFAPFDKDGRPLRNGILWLDGRATEQIRRYGSEHIHELSGKPAGVTPAIYKMAWVKEHEPEIFADAYKVMDVHGYVAWMLTGRRGLPRPLRHPEARLVRRTPRHCGRFPRTDGRPRRTLLRDGHPAHRTRPRRGREGDVDPRHLAGRQQNDRIRTPGCRRPRGNGAVRAQQVLRRAHQGGKRLLVGSAMTEMLGVADPTEGQ